MGIAFALSENDDDISARAEARNSSKHSPSFRKSIMMVKKKSGSMNAVAFAGANWELYIAPWQQLMAWYMILLLLTGFGGLIFWYCEYDVEAVELATRRAFMKGVEEKYDNFPVQKQLLEEWADRADEFLDTNKWDFRYGVFFSATTFATIGYGVQSPQTTLGRASVFLYGAPAIACYVYAANLIGELFLALLADLITSTCISERAYQKYQLYYVGIVMITMMLCMGMFIHWSATDEGFGQGITTYGNSLYFLFQTTLTIGYGDVMMSGSSTLVSLLLAIWLSTSLGVSLNFIQLVLNQNRQTRRSNIVDCDIEVEKFQRRSKLLSIESQLWGDLDLLDDEVEKKSIMNQKINRVFIKKKKSRSVFLENDNNTINKDKSLQYAIPTQIQSQSLHISPAKEPMLIKNEPISSINDPNENDC